jgi:tetratricopeptide (TPR) repeat protein
VNVIYGYDQHQKSKITNSITLSYSDFISATFAADNKVTWHSMVSGLNYNVTFGWILLGIEGERPPFHVMIDADITINPETLDLADKRVFTAFIKLPKGYNVNDIDPKKLSCEGALAVKGMVSEGNKYRAEFNIQDLVNVPVGDAVTLTLTGQLTDKTQFEGIITVKVVNTQFAEEKYEEAVTAFSSGDYKSAEQLFKQAQKMYSLIGDSAKVSECQDLIDQCADFLEKLQLKAEKAEALFKEGVTHFEQQQYEVARTKFEEALTQFTELGDEEKVKECEEWIVSCEEQLEKEESRGFCTGSIMIMFLLLGGALRNLFIGRSDREAKQ